MIKLIAELFGYELIRKKKNASLKSHLQNILKRCDINLVLDVGANHGQFGTLLRSIGYKGEILSFEPVGEAFEALRIISSHDKNWRVLKLGLSDKKESAEINVFESSDFNSLLKPSSLGKDAFKKLNQSHTESIDLDMLDNLVRNNKDLNNRNIFLKMDTQGYDLNVFRGATQSLSKITAMLSEISFQPIYENMPDYHQVLTEYEAAGFVVTGLYPVSRKSDGSIIEMDCVMLNSNCSSKPHTQVAQALIK